ncbi:BTAD domain-containing putative transcriptional regulator [Actinoplanes sp. NEAU-A12]|uniref:BTAD domain-containing putative transcriptional regulator n=1 Tax=Actinoplanes sandaracinus TaxID=3045177 RepID=A0ABT6WQX0_9ACTN|nr:BTAD domain-containing putative transcriptional regulator [Actinoplanes sandaracinus]MDI6102124.1 BTAD domain-containing putative transcriptional regulator [Actinoplanes sandaracinus]
MTDGSPAVGLRFEILGPVRAYRGAEPVDLGPVKQQAVLAVLLLHAGTPVPISSIIAALWGGDPPENGIDIVQRYVGGLRRALDPERTSLIALTPGGYVLHAGETAVDAALFRAALTQARGEHRIGDPRTASDEVRRALGLWQDEPLAGLTGPVFESARARLNQERAAAAQLLVKPAHPDPSRVEPARPDRTRVEPARPDRTRVEPARPDRTRVEPARPDRTRVEPARPDPTRVAPAHGEPVSSKPAYPEPVDPWAGHELFPPD